MRMNKLDNAKRANILSMLVEGSSMRSISRVVDVSINRRLSKPSPQCAGYGLATAVTNAIMGSSSRKHRNASEDAFRAESWACASRF